MIYDDLPINSMVDLSMATLVITKGYIILHMLRVPSTSSLQGEALAFYKLAFLNGNLLNCWMVAGGIALLVICYIAMA